MIAFGPFLSTGWSLAGSIRAVNSMAYRTAYIAPNVGDPRRTKTWTFLDNEPDTFAYAATGQRNGGVTATADGQWFISLPGRIKPRGGMLDIEMHAVATGTAIRETQLSFKTSLAYPSQDGGGPKLVPIDELSGVRSGGDGEITLTGVDVPSLTASYEPSNLLAITLRSFGNASGGSGSTDANFQLRNFDLWFEPSLGGDIRLDGVVDLADVGTFKAHFGDYGGCRDCDLTGDQVVGLDDFGVMKANFGKSEKAFLQDLPSGPIPTPEPSGLVLGLLAGIALLASLRRR